MSLLFILISIVLVFIGMLIVGISGFTPESFALAAIVVIVGFVGTLFVMDRLRQNKYSTPYRGRSRSGWRQLKKHPVPVALSIGVAMLLVNAFHERAPMAKKPAPTALAQAPKDAAAPPAAQPSPAVATAPAPASAPAMVASSPPAPVAGKPTAPQAIGDVTTAIETWRSAWEAKDVERYLAAYAPDFQPQGGLSLVAWRQQRKDRVGRASKLQITLEDQDISVNGDQATARFRQRYRSATVQDTVRKQLTLVRTQAGWRIRTEANL